MRPGQDRREPCALVKLVVDEDGSDLAAEPAAGNPIRPAILVLRSSFRVTGGP